MSGMGEREEVLEYAKGYGMYEKDGWDWCQHHGIYRGDSCPICRSKETECPGSMKPSSGSQ